VEALDILMKNKEKIIGSIAIIVVFSGFLIFGYMNSKTEKLDDKEIFIESNAISKTAVNSENKSLKVQIRGEVEAPGVYTMESGSRVEDLIKIAGGLTEKADKDRIVSQAKKLKDEECITIPAIQLISETSANNVNSGIVRSLPDISNKEDKININTAPKEDLMKIPGVGEVIAGNIIDFREKNGEFNVIEDLKKVDRIGEKTFEKMKEKIEVR
jgi:competence protein ComEA